MGQFHGAFPRAIPKNFLGQFRGDSGAIPWGFWGNSGGDSGAIPGGGGVPGLFQGNSQLPFTLNIFIYKKFFNLIMLL